MLVAITAITIIQEKTFIFTPLLALPYLIDIAGIMRADIERKPTASEIHSLLSVSGATNLHRKPNNSAIARPSISFIPSIFMSFDF